MNSKPRQLNTSDNCPHHYIQTLTMHRIPRECTADTPIQQRIVPQAPALNQDCTNFQGRANLRKLPELGYSTMSPLSMRISIRTLSKDVLTHPLGKLGQAAPTTQGQPSLAELMGMASHSQDIEPSRKQLASTILAVLADDMQRPDTKFLSEVVSLLDEIWDNDHGRFNRIFDTNSYKYEEIKTRWTYCISGLVYFCALAGYTDQESNLTDLLGDVDTDLPLPVITRFTHVRGVISEWKLEDSWDDERFARDVTFVLFHSASWHPRMMSLGKMEGLVGKFVEELMAWFE